MDFTATELPEWWRWRWFLSPHCGIAGLRDLSHDHLRCARNLGRVIDSSSQASQRLRGLSNSESRTADKGNDERLFWVFSLRWPQAEWLFNPPRLSLAILRYFTPRSLTRYISLSPILYLKTSPSGWCKLLFGTFPSIGVQTQPPAV